MAETRRRRGSGAAEKRGPKGNAPSERDPLCIRPFPLLLKLNEPMAAASRNILGQSVVKPIRKTSLS